MARFQKAAATPRISVSSSRAAFFGPALDLAPHRNAVATVAIAMQTPFALEFFDDGVANAERRVCRIAIVPPGRVHHLRATGDMIFVYLDALGDDYERFRTLDLDYAHRHFMRMLGDAVVRDATGSSPSTDVESVCASLGVPRRAPSDGRLQNAVRSIDARPRDFGSIDGAAKLCGLSTSRFQHVFREDVGLPFRRYRLWRRMVIVARALACGSSLTTAAFEAGFSSSAHLSTAFKAMFGLRPSTLLAIGTRFESVATDA